MCAASARSTLMAHVRLANIRVTSAACCLANAVTTFTCIASSSGSNRTLRKDSAPCVVKNSNGMAAPMPPKHHWPKQPKAKCSPRPRPEIAVIATGQLGSLAAYLHTESHGLANQKLSFHIMKTTHLH